jgi:hypothetical protein
MEDQARAQASIGFIKLGIAIVAADQKAAFESINDDDAWTGAGAVELLFPAIKTLLGIDAFYRAGRGNHQQAIGGQAVLKPPHRAEHDP